MSKFYSGEIEIVLLVPLLLCVLLLNFTLIESFGSVMDDLKELKRAYEDATLGYYYFTDPVSGNLYPMPILSKNPQMEGRG